MVYTDSEISFFSLEETSLSGSLNVLYSFIHLHELATCASHQKLLKYTDSH